MVPIPLKYSGEVHLKLVENGEVDGQVQVTGTHVRLKMHGESNRVEKFPGLRKPNP
jgi:hypothetical protein